MRSDPRVGLIIALAVAAVAMGWLLMQPLFGDALFATIGYAIHAITLLAIFALIAGLAVALLFRRFVQVRADLLAHRDIIAHWTVGAEDFAEHATRAMIADRAERRGALATVLFFVAVIFGLFALFDAEAAPAMVGMASLVAVALAAAYLLGGRAMRRQLEPTSREVIVGAEGLIVNGVLHVWGTYLTWLVGATIERGRPASLVVTYAYLARVGPQFVSVVLPVPPEAMPLAELVVDRFDRHGRTRRPKSARADGVEA